MSKISAILVASSFFMLTMAGAVFSSMHTSLDAGHSHSVSERHSGFLYKDVKEGLEAHLELRDLSVKKDTQDRFVAVCELRAFIVDPRSGEHVDVAGMAIRSTLDHAKFGKAQAMVPDENRMLSTSLMVNEHGEQHFLLIADVPGLGSKEFHFHHTF